MEERRVVGPHADEIVAAVFGRPQDEVDVA
jgi:hypothetical protein